MLRAQDFLDLMRARPFIPLRIHLSDGRSFDVRHPEMMLVTKSFLYVAVSLTPGVIAEHTERIAIMHVTSVKELAPAGEP